MKRAMKFSGVRIPKSGMVSEEDARKLITAHRGNLYKLIMGTEL